MVDSKGRTKIWKGGRYLIVKGEPGSQYTMSGTRRRGSKMAKEFLFGRRRSLFGRRRRFGSFGSGRANGLLQMEGPYPSYS